MNAVYDAEIKEKYQQKLKELDELHHELLEAAKVDDTPGVVYKNALKTASSITSEVTNILEEELFKQDIQTSTMRLLVKVIREADNIVGATILASNRWIVKL